MSGTGTYVGLRVLQPTASKLADYCRENGIRLDSSNWERRLHTTLIYSRVHCPNLRIDPSTIYHGKFAGFDLFTGVDGRKNVLVVKLASPQITARHEQLMQENGATWDHESYQPHVTLNYSFNKDISNLPAIDFPIEMGLEYSEDIRDLKKD